MPEEGLVLGEASEIAEVVGFAPEPVPGEGLGQSLLVVSVRAPFVLVEADPEEDDFGEAGLGEVPAPGEVDPGECTPEEAIGPAAAFDPEEASDLEEASGLVEASGPGEGDSEEAGLEAASALVSPVLEGLGFEEVELLGRGVEHADLFVQVALVLVAMAPLAAVPQAPEVAPGPVEVDSVEVSGPAAASVQKSVVYELESGQATAVDPSRAFSAVACGSGVEAGCSSGETGVGLVGVFDQEVASVGVDHVRGDIDLEEELGLGAFGLEVVLGQGERQRRIDPCQAGPEVAAAVAARSRRG